MDALFENDLSEPTLRSLDSDKLADIPTKHDGTADMRYKESQEAVSSGLISKDEVIEGTSFLSLSSSIIIVCSV